MSAGKLEGAERFRHFLWRHHTRRAWQNFLPELVATDGHIVRRIVSRDRQIVFQIFEDDAMAMSIAGTIEAAVEVGDALLGYSLYVDEETVAILRTGAGRDPGWLAIPYSHVAHHQSRFPTLPLKVVSIPSLRLVGGVTLNHTPSGVTLRAAIEQRGSSFAASEHAFDLLSHLRKWELNASVEKDGELMPVRLIKKPGLTFGTVSGSRAEAEASVDSWIYREYRDDPSLKIWFVLQFDDDLFCLPDQWLKFWLHAEVGE